jgi:hypothetical protein
LVYCHVTDFIKPHLFHLRQQPLSQICCHRSHNNHLILSFGQNPHQFVLNLKILRQLHGRIEWRNFAMAPMVESFPASQLESRIQYVPNGRRRKPPVDLKDCELKELLQYHCDLNGPPNDPRSRVVCEPILRLFRK